MLLLLGALSVLYVTLAQLSYPILLAIWDWVTPDSTTPVIVEKPTWTQFSSAYTALILYFILVLISSKKSLGVFTRLGSLGAVFFSMFVISITILGAVSFSNT